MTINISHNKSTFSKSNFLQEKKQERTNNDYNENTLSGDIEEQSVTNSTNNSNEKMSLAMTIFRSRRNLGKKSGDLVGSFEYVLDEDVLPKAEKILQIARSSIFTGNKLLQQAKSLFPDASDLSLVLQELIQQTKTDKIVSEKLKATLEKLEDSEDAKMLKAGINCALKARLFARAISFKPDLLRASYRQFIQSNESETEIYSEWIGNYGYNHRLIVLDYMEGALLCDIDSHDPSCCNLEFGYLLGRLSQLKLLRSADICFIKKMTLISFFNFHNNIDESKWLLIMFSLLQRTINVDTLLNETIEFNLITNKQRKNILQELYVSSKILPEKLFSDQNRKNEILNSIKSMTDLSIR